MNRLILTGLVVALVAGGTLANQGCSTRSAVGGAAAGAAAAGGIYEYQNKRAMDELEREYSKGEISRAEYERRKEEISRRSLVY